MTNNVELVTTKIDQLLQRLADAIGTTVEHLLAVYTTQVRMEGILCLSIFTIAMIGISLLWVISFVKFKKIESETRFIIFVLLSIALFIVVIAGAIGIVEWVTAIFNSEYAGISRIIAQISKITGGSSYGCR